MFCSHYRSELSRNDRTPIAVSLGWMLLGLMLNLSFDFWMTDLLGLVLFGYNAYHFIKGNMAIACCMRQRKRAIARSGEDPGSCLSKTSDY